MSTIIFAADVDGRKKHLPVYDSYLVSGVYSYLKSGVLLRIP